MGLVHPRPTLIDPCHNRRCPSIHRDNGAAEGCQGQQVMEQDAWFGFRG